MRARSFEFDGFTYSLARGVFDPVHHLSGVAVADQLGDFVAECGAGVQTALDLGTGSGLLAATMARHGLSVVATDVSVAAVACAAQNCAGLDVDVRQGDMFDPVERCRFDVAIVNPPYERGRSSWRRSAAFTSVDFLERLGARVHNFAPTLLLGFPEDQAADLAATGLDLAPWRSVTTSGRRLGLFRSTDCASPGP